MNKKLVSLGILFLLALMLSGCVWVGGYGYNHGYPPGYNGYSYRYHHGDLDDHHIRR